MNFDLEKNVQILDNEGRLCYANSCTMAGTKSTWAEEMDLDEINQRAQTDDSRNGNIIHNVLFTNAFERGAPKMERPRPNKPLCRKGDACFNKKCTFVHPNRQ
jgi:hypothetical protein